MDIVENDKVLQDLDERASQVFSDFMMRITKFEELVLVGGRFLAGLHQHLELLRRRSIHNTSEVVDDVIKANQTKRLKAYISFGCINVSEGVQSVSKLNECQKGLQEHISKAKELLSEVECLTNVILEVLSSVTEITFKDGVQHLGDSLVVLQLEKEEMESVGPRKPSVSDYATMMGCIYVMLKQDYIMQEKIISSLEICFPSSEELGSYLMMWNLRPCINDEIIQDAWKFIT